jgi:hypothetical protein
MTPVIARRYLGQYISVSRKIGATRSHSSLFAIRCTELCLKNGSAQAAKAIGPLPSIAAGFIQLIVRYAYSRSSLDRSGLRREEAPYNLTPYATVRFRT